jgi:hypothetical protein
MEKLIKIWQERHNHYEDLSEKYKDNEHNSKKFIYKAGQCRLDKISQQYYGSPYFGWLIMTSNPIYGGQEWNIPDGSILTIPFPLVASLQDYKNALDNHFFYYGR